jgi:hypothetical protein
MPSGLQTGHSVLAFSLGFSGPRIHQRDGKPNKIISHDNSAGANRDNRDGNGNLRFLLLNSETTTMKTVRTPAFAALRRGKQNRLTATFVVSGLTHHILASILAGDGRESREPNP